MVDTILASILLVFFFFAYVLTIFFPFHISKGHKLSIKRYKKWFLLSMGVAIFIVLYLMDTEKNLIPMIGYLFLIGVTSVFGNLALSGLVVPSEERSHKGKRLLKVSYGILASAMILTIIWVIVWWKEIYS